MEKLGQTGEETEYVIHQLLHNINVVALDDYKKFIKHAIEVSPDEYDAPYFAVSLNLKIPLWSNDKRLKKQDQIKVLNTAEVLAALTAEKI